MPREPRATRFGAPAWCERVGRLGHPRCPVYVAPSKIPGAGRGVFARVDLPKGTFVTPYDGPRFRGAVRDSQDTRVVDYALELEPASSLERHEKVSILGLPPSPADFGPDGCLRDGRLLEGHPPDARGALGHLLNDAVHVEVTGLTNNSKFEFVAGRAYVVTTQKVKAGRELLISYHVSYWAARAGKVRRPRALAAFCEAMRAARVYLKAELGKEPDAYLGHGAFALEDRTRVVLAWCPDTRRPTLAPARAPPDTLYSAPSGGVGHRPRAPPS